MITGDGHIWTRLSHYPFLSSQFWFASRPFTFPLVYKVLGPSDVAVIWFQTFLAIFAWTLLASSLARLFDGAKSLLTFALVLLLSLTTPVHAWDIIVRSESTGISLLVICIASSVNFAHPAALAQPRKRRTWMWLAIASGILAAFDRESNAYVLPLLAAFVVLASSAGARGSDEATGIEPERRTRTARHSTRAWMLAAALLLTSVAAQLDMQASHRYVFPLTNVIFQRVLTDASKLRYFEECAGMPSSNALLRYRRKWASSDNRSAFHAADMSDFRNWMDAEGYGAYQKYLLSHLGATAREAHDHYAALAQADFERVGRPSENPLTACADQILLFGPPASYPDASIVIAAALASIALLRPWKNYRTVALFILFCAASAVTQTYICYHADAMELERHAVMVGILLRLTGIVACVLALCLGDEAIRSGWRYLAGKRPVP